MNEARHNLGWTIYCKFEINYSERQLITQRLNDTRIVGELSTVEVTDMVR